MSLRESKLTEVDTRIENEIGMLRASSVPPSLKSWSERAVVFLCSRRFSDRRSTFAFRMEAVKFKWVVASIVPRSQKQGD